MTNKFTVLVDCDDVMNNLVETWCWWLNMVHGTAVSAKEITQWDVRGYFPSLTEKEIYEPLQLGSFWYYVKPKEGAVEYLKKMLDDGFDIYVCTASNYETIKDKYEDVIRRYFPFISWNRIIIAKNKQMIRGDVLIDDGVHNLENGSYDKILMSTPHNINYDAEANGMIRASSWEDAYNAVLRCYASRQRKGREL